MKKTLKNCFKVLSCGLLLSSCLGLTVNAQEFELLDSKPEAQAYQANNEPTRIYTTFNGEPSSEMGFAWYTTELLEDARVLVSALEDMSDPLEFEAEAKEVTSTYAERDEDGYTIYEYYEEDADGEVVLDENEEPTIVGYTTAEGHDDKAWTSSKSVGVPVTYDVSEVVYHAQATGLEPNTTYYYQVGSDDGGFSDVRTFKTAGESSDDFSFIHLTDTQNAYWNEFSWSDATFAAATTADALETLPDSSFILFTGDMIERAELEDDWMAHTTKLNDSLAQQAVMSISGNADEDAIIYQLEPFIEKYNEHVNVPVTNDAIDGGSYYSHNYNGVHFAFLNTNDNKESEDNPEQGALGREQLDWLREDLEKASQDENVNWIAVVAHKPLFSRSYHSLQDTDVQIIREELMEMIDEYDVDIVFHGHDHVGSRTLPLSFVPTEENFSNGVVDPELDVEEIDGVDHYNNPEGTVFVLPGTAGPKWYADLYKRPVEWIHEHRPNLDWMTQEDVDYYDALFAFGYEPEDPVFENSYQNNRDSDTQLFATYEVTENTFSGKIYKTSGNVLEGEEREIELVDAFTIQKD